MIDEGEATESPRGTADAGEPSEPREPHVPGETGEAGGVGGRGGPRGPRGPRGPGGPDEPREPTAASEAAPAPAAGPDDGLPGDDLTEAQLEALLFVAERPLGRRELATLTGASTAVVDARLGDLEVALAGRGIRLVVDADRVALATAPEAGLLVGRYVGREPARLSPATLETLAIVAYRQPVTKAAVERIRGVDADYAIRSLLHRRLVVELGRADAPGRPFLYGTSVEFLERFGLLSLDDLPVLDAAVAERLAGPGPENGRSERDSAGADDEPGAGDAGSGDAAGSDDAGAA